jgi:hypothetical protein
MNDPVPLPALLTEAEANDLYGHVLEDHELRRARQHRAIGYYKRKGKILYRADELAAFVEARLERSYVAPCQKPSDSDDTGSPQSQAQANSTVVGMTPELEKSGADLLRQMISRKPRSCSPPSSSRKAKLKLVIQET